MSTTTDHSIRSLLCTCCGGRTRGRQFYNQDTGFGLCPSCADRILSRWPKPEHEGTDWRSFEQTYGVRGVHFAIIETA